MITSFFTQLFTAPLEIIYWIKWTIAYICIRIHIALNKRRFGLYDLKAYGDPVKLGLVVPQLEKDLESPFPESHLEKATDEVLFYGVNSKSECLLVRVSRGSNQVSDAWIHLKLANGKCYELAESAGPQHPFEGGKCPTFSCGKLQMHYLSPMRRWRIFYCGMLKETTGMKSEGEKSVFVKFIFLWKASSDVYDLTLESNATGFTNVLAKTEWNIPLVPPIAKFVEATNFYGQSGTIHGTVSVDEGNDYELYLFGEKTRNLGKTANIIGCDFTNIMGNIPTNGFTFHLGKASIPYIFNNLPYGFVVHPDTRMTSLQDVDINIQTVEDGNEKTIKAVFVAGNRYEVQGKVIGEPIILHSELGGSGYEEASFIEFLLGKKKGYGFILSGRVNKKISKKSKETTATSFPKTVPLTALLSDEVSQFREISGGKGSSLGQLTKLSKEGKTFTVPKGMVVTTAAYKEFLTPEIISAVKNLEDVAYGNVDGDIKENCKMVSDLVIKTLFPAKIRLGIEQDLKHLFGNETEHHRFAVRSSATGEDGAVMSAAGQMETFLGIQGFDEIILAVKKCWASQFGHIAVEYKKRYGQILNSPMAVVIQEMVACEVSGVLFTCDPVTNNPSVITITANYGLGETVVSGSVEPDTIILKRDTDGKLDLELVLVGAKRQKLVMQENGGTEIEDIPEEARQNCCLTTELAEYLGKLSIKIENYYRSSRDIEWGIVEGNVYIFQSRPVTNTAAENEFEMKHELDDPVRCENEYFTVANVGEVMPGATSPLGMDVTTKFFRNLIQRLTVDRGLMDNFMCSKYFPTGIRMFCNHMLMTAAELVFRYGINTPMSKGYMISLFGRVLDDPDLLEFVYEKVPKNYVPKFTVLQSIQHYRDLFLHDWGMENIKQKYGKHHLNFLNHKTAKDTFTSLLNSCSDFDEPGNNFLISSGCSSNWNMFIFQTLSDANKGRIDADVYGDFAQLLSTSSNVESADVPQSLQEVAVHIAKDVTCENFKLMPVEEALEWLEKSKTPSGYKFREFIKRHGHRCLKECDIHSKTWETDTKHLVKLLQNLAGNAKDTGNKEVEDYDKMFSELQVPLGLVSKYKLKFILPFCRKGVRAREAYKSIIVKCFDYWRKGFSHLASQMVAEGRIPDQDLFFFLSIEEIKDLLETRSPKIISRAIHRRRIFPTLNNYIFPEIIRGIPKPLNEAGELTDASETESDLIMKGIPVSQGVVKGYARVAVTLEEASFLKHGEILITYSTDIGWSPYFPIISGVVTELGGLISHGAVVSREYGLPCIVGLHGATSRFHTGDYVLLDGKKGMLQRLPKPEQEQ